MQKMAITGGVGEMMVTESISHAADSNATPIMHQGRNTSDRYDCHITINLR